MNTPAHALAWEIWRKNRYGFWLLAGLLLACSALTRLAVHYRNEAAYLATTLASDAPELFEATLRASGVREIAGSWGLCLFAGSLLIVFAVFAFAESHLSRGFSGIPSRFFAYPVRTAHLVRLPVLGGITCVTLLYFAWSRLVLAPVHPLDEAMPDDYLLLLLTSALVVFQALVWVLPNFPKTRATLLTILITFVIYLSTLPFSDLARWTERKLALMILFAVALVGAPMTACVGVGRLRRGDWRDWPALTRWASRLADLLSRHREFSTARSALLWIDFRRSGLPALGLLAVVILVILGLASLERLEGGVSNARSIDLFGSTVSPILLFLVSVWIPVVGLIASSDGVSRRLRMTVVQAVRPVTAGEFVAARLKAMGLLWLGGWLMSVIAISVWAVGSGLTDELFGSFSSDRNPQLLVSLILISLHLLFGLFPLWLTGRVPDLPWSFLILLIVYSGLGNIIFWFERHADFWPLALLLIGFAGAVKLGLAAIAFRQALERKLAGRGFVFGVTVAWVVGTALVLNLTSELTTRAGWSGEIVLSFAALLVPIARIALAPLALSMNRHR